MIVVTSRVLCGGKFLERIATLADAGPELIVLREKDLTHEDYLGLARECLEICTSYNVPLALNSDALAARELEVGILHLPMHILRTEDISTFDIVGASVHSVEEAVEAEVLGADYLIAGHVFHTSCKSTDPRGLDFLRSVCAAVDIPVYGIGGMVPENHRDVLDQGAAGAAVMSTAMTCDEPRRLVDSMQPRETSIFHTYIRHHG